MRYFDPRRTVSVMGASDVLEWPDHDSDETLDYALDWSSRLAGDTIRKSDWTVPNGISGHSGQIAGAEAVILISGGAPGATYTLTNLITTAAGRVMDQSVGIRILEE